MSASKWILGITASLLLLPRLLRVTNLKDNIITNVTGIKANIRFNPLPSLNIIIDTVIQNFSGLNITINNFWIRVQFQTPSGTWKDLANSPNIINRIEFTANNNVTQRFNLSIPSLAILGQGITNTTPFRIITNFDYAGYPNTIVVKEFKIGDYVDFSILNRKSNASENLISGL